MSQRPYATEPLKTRGMPPGIPFIVGNEAAERFCFYSLQAILVVYMTHRLRASSGVLDPMSENEAEEWYHVFVATNYFFPTLGALVSDAFWGKYRTIFWLSLVYCAGSVVLASDLTRVGLACGLGLIALGAGGIKPCVSSHVGDQFGAANERLISRAFGWFYLAVNVGSTVSFLLAPRLMEDHGPRPAFALPACFMLLATFVFWRGRYRFAHIPPRGKRFLEEAFSRHGLATLGRLATIYVFVAIFWSLWYQSSAEWVVQAERMNLHFLGFTWLAPQMQVANAVMIVALIPVFEYLVYPWLGRFFAVTPLRRIGIGLVVTGCSFFMSAWIESRLQAGLKPNIGWQLPGYFLLSMGEVLVSITSLEFAYTQAPKTMKSIVTALYLLSITGGNLLTALVHRVVAGLRGPAYYEFYAFLAIGCVLVYIPVAKAYRGKTYVQGGAEPAAEAEGAPAL